MEKRLFFYSACAWWMCFQTFPRILCVILSKSKYSETFSANQRSLLLPQSPHPTSPTTSVDMAIRKPFVISSQFQLNLILHREVGESREFVQQKPQVETNTVPVRRQFPGYSPICFLVNPATMEWSGHHQSTTPSSWLIHNGLIVSRILFILFVDGCHCSRMHSLAA